MSETLCVGLFGTCGDSRWRDPFIAAFAERGIPFFNPQVAPGTWHPGMVDDENRHLREDALIVFPVTAETTGQGSLAEIGFSAMNALRMNRQRYFVFLIDDQCRDPSANEAQISESNRSRRLVKSKLAVEAAEHHNIFLVESMEAMLALSLDLWEQLIALQQVEATYKARSI